MLTNRHNSPQRLSGTGSSAGEPELSPLSIIRMFWKHKLQILLLWIVLSAIGAVIVYRLPSVYKAEATILVDSQKIPDKYVMPTVNSGIEDRVLTLKKEIMAGESLQAVIDQFGLYREQRKSLTQEEILDLMAADTQVELEKGWTRDRPGAFKITYQGSDPRVVAEVANNIADRFIRRNLDNRKDHADRTKNFLTEQLKLAGDELGKLESAVSDFKLKYNGELPEQEGSLGAILSRLQVELQGNQDAMNRAQQQKLMLENSISGAESSLASMMSMAEQSGARQNNGDPGAARPQKESEALQARLDILRVRYSDDHPEIKRLRAEIAQLREAESRTDAEAAKGPSTAGQQPGPAPATSTSDAPAPLRVSAETAEKLVQERERLANLKSSLALANRELELRNAEGQKIIANIRTYTAKLEKLPVREQQMASLMRDYEISKENYKRLLDNKVSAEMAAQMELEQQGEKFTPLQPARVPEVPFKPIRPLWLSVACLAGLVLSLVTAAIREIRKGTFLGEWELPSGVPVLGRVPWIAIEQIGFDSPSDAGSGHWLQRRRPQALVLSVVVCLACGIAAAFYRGWLKF